MTRAYRLNGMAMHKHPLYYVYRSMISRCYTESSSRWDRYGGRGISVCDRWIGVEGFWNFVKDMGERPKGYQIDRVDSNGNYEPSNCRWVSPREQALNRTNNRKVSNVYENRNSYQFKILLNGVRHTKTFPTFEEAVKYKEEYLNEQERIELEQKSKA